MSQVADSIDQGFVLREKSPKQRGIKTQIPVARHREKSVERKRVEAKERDLNKIWGTEEQDPPRRVSSIKVNHRRTQSSISLTDR